MNYIGSKYSLLNFLEQTIEEVTGFKNADNHIFVDLFAGTGIVGSRYKEKGYNVISNDIQYYSYVLNKHLIENTNFLHCNLVTKLNNLELVDGFIYKNYCFGSGSNRKYFTDINGKKCDAIRIKLENLYKTKKINEQNYFYYLASLISSIDKYANTASVYGAFLKDIKKSAQRNFQLELLPIISGKSGKVYNEDANELIKKISGDILYLDPPYNTRQYASNYHILETIAKYDNPTIYRITGLRKDDNKKSKFCSKKMVTIVFEDLIKNAKFKYIFLSYNNEGLMSLDTIKEIMKKYGEYKCFTKDYRRFKADKEDNRNINSNYTIEYLHCLIKK